MSRSGVVSRLSVFAQQERVRGRAGRQPPETQQGVSGHRDVAEQQNRHEPGGAGGRGALLAALHTQNAMEPEQAAGCQGRIE
ncbi:MAG: hypothetical protein FJ386_00115 [Verrucomicrobia bacterium]|nr:hypothetical protein [Verrucomicrobiota bacterium]